MREFVRQENACAMQLAVSNIAWPTELEHEAAKRLAALGLTGVEIAPTKVWREPVATSPLEAARYRGFWESHGLRIVALQSLLFGHNDLQLFQHAASRQAMFERLSGMIRLAALLGAEVLVFGSPKNRVVGTVAPVQAHCIALEFFRRLGQFAHDQGVWFCIEPNPSQYGCDFVTTAAEGLALVESVAQPGFGLHLDAGGMTLAGDNAHEVMPEAGKWWRHFHVSEPFLQPVGSGDSRHEIVSEALRTPVIKVGCRSR